MPKAAVASSISLNARPLRRGALLLYETVRLRTADGYEVDVTPTIHQHLSMEWGSGFGNAESMFYEPMTHHFDVVVSRERMRDGEVSAAQDRHWEAIRSAYAAFGPSEDAYDVRTRPQTDDEIWLAHLSIVEVPAHMVEQGGGWMDACDYLGDTLRASMELVQGIVEDESDFAPGGLMDGSLLWPRILGVHPRARGQRIGLQLLVHGLWTLQRSTCDVAIIEAAAVASYFDAVKPPQTDQSFRALCRHYGRIGFRRWLARKPIGSAYGNIMYLPLGERGIEASFAAGGALHGRLTP